MCAASLLVGFPVKRARRLRDRRKNKLEPNNTPLEPNTFHGCHCLILGAVSPFTLFFPRQLVDLK